MILTVYGRFFKLYLYTAIAPIPLSTFAGEPSQNVGKSFVKSYSAVCLEGAIIILACIIFSLFASSPPAIDTSAEAYFSRGDKSSMELCWRISIQYASASRNNKSIR